MFHRCSASFTLHDHLECVHVGDFHGQSNAIGRIWLNEGANILRHAAKGLFTLFRRKPVCDVVHLVGCNELWHSGTSMGRQKILPVLFPAHSEPVR
jgi:hypothetical protein